MPYSAVFLDKATLGPHVDLSPISKLVALKSYNSTQDKQIIPRIKNYPVIITNKVVLNQLHLTHAKKLKHIFLAATGMNNIDLDYCKQNNIEVWPVSNYSQSSVANHALALMLSLKQNLMAYNQLSHNQWHKSNTFCLFKPPITELDNQTMGIIGYGHIGKKMERYAKMLNMKALIAARNSLDKRRGRVSIDDIFKQADVVTLHCLLTKDTYQLANKKRIDSMKKGAILINTSRGQLIDEQALAKAITQNKISAGLDVITKEPPTKSNPLLKINQQNLIVTPHIAWIADTTRARLIQLLATNIKRALPSGNRP